VEGASLKRNASQAELDAKNGAGPSSGHFDGVSLLLQSADALKGAPKKRSEAELQPDDEMVDADAEEDADAPLAKRRKRRGLGKAEAAKLPSPVASPVASAQNDGAGASLAELPPPKTISALLKELEVPRKEKIILADGNNQFAAIADQVHG
jgi:hypothetical protein